MNIKFLDHIAITVRDPEKSAKWYKTVLGLKKVQHKDWGAYPIMMLAGETGIALFPTKSKKPVLVPEGDFITAKHFAFRVDYEEFVNAQEELNQKNIPFEFENHEIFHSIYLKDPDNHTVELTAVNPEYTGN